MILIAFALAACNQSDNGGKENLKAIYQDQAVAFENANQRKMQLLEMAQVGKPAIPGNFTAIDGSLLPSDSLKGKLVVMDFWATWCAPCLERIPHFYEMAEKYDTSKAAFLLVNVDTEKSHWEKFIKGKSWTKNSYWIGDESANNPLIGYAYSKIGEGDTAHAILSLPKIVAIDKGGKIKAHYDGKMNGAEFEN